MLSPFITIITKTILISAPEFNWICSGQEWSLCDKCCFSFTRVLYNSDLSWGETENQTNSIQGNKQQQTHTPSHTKPNKNNNTTNQRIKQKTKDLGVLCFPICFCFLIISLLLLSFTMSVFICLSACLYYFLFFAIGHFHILSLKH